MSTDYTTLRDSSLDALKSYMDSLDPEQGKKLAYWVKDYANFLSKEHTFKPDKLIKYKRGSVIKVHLGYRVGSEEGGLHYAIVMDRNNSIHSPTVTVIPLTSVKDGVDLSSLHPSKLHIDNEIYTCVTNALNKAIEDANNNLKILEAIIEGTEEKSEERKSFKSNIRKLKQQLSYCNKLQEEVDHMKQGSIALIGQITTVSKLRIYDPKYKNDALSKIRVSSKTLDLLDAKVQELFGSPATSKA